MKQLNAQRALALGAGLVIVALTAAAFWLSYSHLAGVAETYGLKASPVRAWAWPACLDLFIVAGELLMLRAALTQSVDPWAIGLTVVGSGGSIALNVAGVGTTAPALAYVVAAVPPTAALLAFGALMRQVHQALAAPAEPIEVVTEPVIIERIAEPDTVTEVVDFDPLPVLGMTTTEATTGPGYVALADIGLKAIQWPPPPADATTEARDKVTTAAASEAARQTVTAVVVKTPAELRKQARKLNAQAVADTGRQVTIETLRSELGLSRRDAGTLRREILEGTRS